MTPPLIRILIADDHLFFVEGLTLILNNQNDMKVIAECASCHETLELISKQSPDLVILDLLLPQFDAADIITNILRRRPLTRILVLATFAADEEIEKAIRAGARGYLYKECRKPKVLEAIRVLYRGGCYFGTV